jgi:membrane protease subunit HflK
MGWNEPGGNGNKPRDPWGGGGNQGPPDLDEVLRNLKKQLSGLFGGGKGGDGSGRPSGGGKPGPLIAIVVGVLAVIYVGIGLFQVDESQRAVVLKFGKFDRVVGPGLNWHTPLFEDYFKANVTQTKTYNVQQEMLTKDTNIVSVALEVQYRVVDPKAYLLRVSRPETVLQHSTESALRHVVGGSTMDEVLKERREEIRVSVQNRLQEYLDRYNTGLTTVNVALNETAAPQPVQDAFNDVARAREDEDRFQKEAQAYANSVIPEARGKAQRIMEEAQAYKEEIIATAEGDAKRFNALLTEYRRAPEVTRERLYLETMEQVLGKTSKVLVDVKEGDNLMYLPLDQIMKRHSEAMPSSGSGNQSSSSSSSSGSNSASSSRSSSSSRGSGGLYQSRNGEIR